MINIMPYKEIYGGNESIYDNIDLNYNVPNKVILYLKTTKPYVVIMGIYKHPFKDIMLCGPYHYTDGEYCWDRDTWKYVVKYHVKLPKSFVDKVMSKRGTLYLEEFAKDKKSWSTIIKRLKEKENTICLLPDNAGDIPLESF